MSIEEEYRGRGSSGRSSRSGRSGGSSSSRTYTVKKTKYDITAEEANKLSPSEKLKYDEYQKNSYYGYGMFLLAFLLAVCGCVFTALVYDSFNKDNFTYFKYEKYVLAAITAAVFFIPAYFANDEFDEAIDRMQELLEEEPATASDEQKKLAATPPPPVVPK